jgi:hypothetical protein
VTREITSSLGARREEEKVPPYSMANLISHLRGERHHERIIPPVVAGEIFI